MFHQLVDKCLSSWSNGLVSENHHFCSNLIRLLKRPSTTSIILFFLVGLFQTFRDHLVLLSIFLVQTPATYITYHISTSKRCKHCQYLCTLRFSLSFDADSQDSPNNANHFESSPPTKTQFPLSPLDVCKVLGRSLSFLGHEVAFQAPHEEGVVHSRHMLALASRAPEPIVWLVPPVGNVEN